MSGFLVLARHRDDAGAFVAAVASLAPMLEASDWKCVWSGDRAVALVRRARELATRPIIRDLGMVVGDLFPRHDSVAPLQMGADAAAFERQCRRLSADHWGRYVAVRWPTENTVAAVFRDPSGGLDCLSWAAAGVTVVSSNLPPDLPATLRPKLSLDWDAIGGLVFDPNRAADALALTGARALWPGEIWYDDPTLAPIQVWTPKVFTAPTSRPDDELQRELVGRVDACVSAWLPAASGALIEVSGGLDSAIVATSAAKLETLGPRVWLNYRASNPRGDERRFARAVSAVGGFELTETAMPLAPLDLDAWRTLSSSVRPPLSALALHRDQDLAARCAADELSRVVTGEGGDLVFFQAPTALVLADLVQSGATPLAVLRATHQVARWSGHSAWRCLFRALGAGRRQAFASQERGPWPALTERAVQCATSSPHPWLEAIDHLPPAKRLQIEALAACQSLNGDSHVARSAVVVHPLLSQPVVELCLQIPTFQLTRCRRDRAFAREAFSARLPPEVTHRRAKGEVSSHSGRVLASSLDVLRPLLMDGELARHGLLDRAQLETLLTPESLIVGGNFYALASTALVETWVSGWVSRL